MEKGKYYETSETGKMHELGNVQHAAQGTRALKPPRNEMPDPIQEKATIKIADNDAAVAVIRNPWHTQNVQQDSRNTNAFLSTGQPTSESSTFSIYSDPSELVAWLRDEIKAINSFDGFMLGVHDQIEKFSRHTQFGLEQVLDVEQHQAKLYESLELYKFTLKQMKAEALKTLRCQGNLGPQRVLQFLRESISKPKTTEQAKEEQAATVSDQNE